METIMDLSNVIPDGSCINLSRESLGCLSEVRSATSIMRDANSYADMARSEVRNIRSQRSSSSPKPESLANLDQVSSYCRSMRYITLYRANLARCSRERDRLERKANEAISRLSDIDFGENLIDLSDLNESINLFSFDVEITSCTITENGAVRLTYRVGEHIMRPNADTSDLIFEWADRYGHGAEWANRYMHCGIKRPSMDVYVDCHIDGDHLHDVIIQFPLTEHNLSQENGFIAHNRIGGPRAREIIEGVEDPDWDYDEASACWHPHSRLRRYAGQYYFSTCTGTYQQFMIERARDGDFIGLTSQLIGYLTGFNPNDQWGGGYTREISIDYMEDYGDSIPIWSPVFNCPNVSEGNRQIVFTNRPNNFHYNYHVQLEDVDGNKTLIDVMQNTESPFIFNDEGIRFIKVVTEQDQVRMNTLMARRSSRRTSSLLRDLAA